MMAETIISSVIILISIAPIIIIGIVQYRSNEPVGFWAGEKPPKKEQITDMKAYNQKHGLMWILYGAGFLLCCACGVFLENMAAVFLCMFEAVGGIFGMIAYHDKLKRMYYRKEGDT